MGKWVIGKYIRLSAADRDLQKKEGKTESDSISHQKSMIEDFILKDPQLRECSRFEFFDDGYSGTNFNRPAFEELMARVKKGEINCVIVKDFSRFGRSYIELGDYLEQIFPFLGVRFISINDHYDSLDYKGTTGGMDVVLKNIIYDFYSKDLSAKVKSAKQAKMKRGEYIGAHPPFGLMKDPEDPHRLVADPETAPIVRKIFDAALGGAGTVEIARRLNEQGTETPGQYYQRTHPDSRRYRKASAHACWTWHMVATILKQEMYYGAVVSQKWKSLGVGTRHSVLVPKEEQIIVENMHQGIITKEEYLEAQKVIKEPRIKKASQDHTYPLWKKVRCGTCGRVMATKTSTIKNKFYRHFSCPYAVTQTGTGGCCKKTIRDEKLNGIVWNCVKPLLDSVENAQEQLQQTKKKAKTDQAENQRQLAALRKAKEKCDADSFANVDSFMAGKLDKETYLLRRKQLREKAALLEGQIAELEKKVHDAELAMDDDTQETLEEIREYTGLTELNQEVVGLMVDQVLVYDPEHVEVKWKFSDELIQLLQG